MTWEEERISFEETGLVSVLVGSLGGSLWLCFILLSHHIRPVGRVSVVTASWRFDSACMSVYCDPLSNNWESGFHFLCSLEGLSSASSDHSATSLFIPKVLFFPTVSAGQPELTHQGFLWEGSKNTLLIYVLTQHWLLSHSEFGWDIRNIEHVLLHLFKHCDSNLPRM